MEERKFTLQDVHQAYKSKDAWWTVLLVDPIASRLVVPVANYTNITPNQISIVSFILGVIAAYNFYLGTGLALITGAILYHISFILDCMDGKIARLKGTGSMFGVLLDIMLDHIRVVICGVALTIGQFQLTGDHTFLLLATLFIFVYFFRHYNALTLYKLRRQMRSRIKNAKAKRRKAERALARVHWLHIEEWIDDEHAAAPLLTDMGGGVPRGPSQNLKKAVQRKVESLVEKSDKELPSKPAEVAEHDPAAIPKKNKIDLQQGFKSKFSWYLKIRDILLKNRIRMHLFSGIEYQMFIFVVAPIIGFIPQIMFFGSIVLFMFEMAIIYKLWLSTKDFEKELAKVNNGTK